MIATEVLARWPHWSSPDGAIVLIHADCLEVLPWIPSESVDMLWTDPPYGHGNAEDDWLSHRHAFMGDGRATVQSPIANDRQDTMRRVMDAVLCEAARILRCCCCCCCCCCCGGGGPTPTFAWVASRMDTHGLSFFHSVIWDKRNPGIGWRYRRQHEMIMVAHRTGGKIAWADDSVVQPNIISIAKPRGGLHPNEKPITLVARFISLHTLAKQVVLDPFMGSGTTAIASLQLGRRFIGVEIDKEHFTGAVARIREETDLLAGTGPLIRAASAGLFPG